MASEIERTIAMNLRDADEEVGEAMVAYRKARRHRAKVYSGAAEVLSQKQIADLTGITQQRVSQIIQEASAKKRPKKPSIKKVRRIGDA